MIKFITIIDGVFTVKEYPGEVEYSPKLKYQINERSPFDITSYIRRKPYHEDRIDVMLILSPTEYSELSDLLNSPVGNGLEGGIFYIEFEYNGAIKQLQVEVEDLPKMSDWQRFGNEAVKIKFVSRYETYTAIDFNNIYGYGNSYGENYGF